MDFSCAGRIVRVRLFVSGSTAMLGHLVYNGHADESGYTFSVPTRGWFVRLWDAVLSLKF
jgi:hypothetical protein